MWVELVLWRFGNESSYKYWKAFDYLISLPCGYKGYCIINTWVSKFLAAERCGSDFKSTLFKIIIQNSSLGTCCEIALRKMPQNLTNENQCSYNGLLPSLLLKTSHYLSQCWSKFVLPYGVTRSQRVKSRGSLKHVSKSIGKKDDFNWNMVTWFCYL